MAHGKHVILLRLQLEPHGYETGVRVAISQRT